MSQNVIKTSLWKITYRSSNLTLSHNYRLHSDSSFDFLSNIKKLQKINGNMTALKQAAVSFNHCKSLVDFEFNGYFQSSVSNI